MSEFEVSRRRFIGTALAAGNLPPSGERPTLGTTQSNPGPVSSDAPLCWETKSAHRNS
jgi:hypothetical protein